MNNEEIRTNINKSMFEIHLTKIFREIEEIFKEKKLSSDEEKKLRESFGLNIRGLLAHLKGGVE